MTVLPHPKDMDEFRRAVELAFDELFRRAILTNSKGDLELDGLSVKSSWQAIADQDATPSVAGGKNFKTNNTVSTTITNFDDGEIGQEIVVHFQDVNTTVDFTASTLVGNGGADWSPAVNDHMRCVRTADKWLCIVS